MNKNTAETGIKQLGARRSCRDAERCTTMPLALSGPPQKADSTGAWRGFELPRKIAAERRRKKRMSEAVRPILQTTVQERDSAPESDAGFLWDFWYPAVRSTAVTGNRLATAMLLEVPLVLGRTSEGKAFAMRDSCPHRGIPLSYGRFDGKTLECSYHGW